MKNTVTTILLVIFSILHLTAGTITLDPNNIPVYVYSSEKPQVMVAYNYLNRDLNKITGKNFVLNSVSSYASIPTTSWSIVVVNCKDGFPDIPADLRAKVTGYESHRVFVNMVTKQIILEGYDMRGTIFAIYTFSENVLGVPPLWYWSSWKPQLKSQITLADDMNIFFDVPDVKYRAFFPNDTDLFSPFMNINSETQIVWIETMMRLKLNTTEQTTVIDIPTKKLTATGQAIMNHGMVLTSHHETILNVEFGKWNDYWTKVRGYTTAPALLLSNQIGLMDFWKYAIEAINASGIENVWVIGLRGDGDRPFWSTFADAPSSSYDRGMIINNLFPKQLQLIKDVTGNQSPETRVILYNELSDLYSGGYLTPPTGNNIMLTFCATRQDPYPNDDLVNFNPTSLTRTGYYMNLQFYTSGCHLAQGEGPWKMETNYRYAWNKANTKLDYSVLNVGNLREFFLETDANSKLLWKFNSNNTNDFLTNFCTTYYGAVNAAETATLYHDFYYAYWEQQKSTFPGMERQFVFQDLRIQNALLRFSNVFSQATLNTPLTDTDGRSYQIVSVYSNALAQVDAVINGMNSSISRWANVVSSADDLYSRLPVDNKVFFNDNLRAQAHLMHQISIALLNVATAYKNKSNSMLASGYFDTAFRAMTSAKNYLYEAEHDIFSNWYDSDSKFNIPLVEARMKEMRDSLQPPVTVKDTIFPVADSYTSCNITDITNYGTTNQLKVSRNNASPTNKYNSYLKFDFTPLNIDLSDISELEFGIYKTADGLTTTRRVDLGLVSTNNWVENTFSGSLRSLNTAFSNTNVFSYFTKNANDPSKCYKITSNVYSNSSLINSVFNQTSNQITIRLFADDNNPNSDDTDAINFNSRESTSRRPYLLVTHRKSITVDVLPALNKNFNIYSVDGTLEINTKEENYRIVVLDIIGRIAIDKSNQSGSLELNRLKKGCYIVNIITKDQRVIQKVLVGR